MVWFHLNRLIGSKTPFTFWSLQSLYRDLMINSVLCWKFITNRILKLLGKLFQIVFYDCDWYLVCLIMLKVKRDQERVWSIKFMWIEQDLKVHIIEINYDIEYYNFHTKFTCKWVLERYIFTIYVLMSIVYTNKYRIHYSI